MTLRAVERYEKCLRTQVFLRHDKPNSYGYQMAPTDKWLRLRNDFCCQMASAAECLRLTNGQEQVT